MPWQNWPPTPGVTDVQAYDYIRQLWYACRERERATGYRYFPPTVHEWYYGTVTAATATSITDANTTNAATPGAVFAPGGWPTSPSLRFVGYTPPPGSEFIPSDYDVVVDDEDETRVVRSPIRDHTATTLTIDDISQAVVEGRIPSVASLVGKRYAIIPRASGSFYPWWSERFPDWPNARQYEVGTIAAATSTEARVDGRRHWTPDQWTPAGSGGQSFDLMAFGSDGKLHRIPLTGGRREVVDADPATGAPATARYYLTYGPQSWGVPGGVYAIVARGGRWQPGRDPMQLTAWYRGVMESYWGHAPDDVMRAVSLPASDYEFPEFDGFTCTAAPHAVFDVDYHVDLDQVCGWADRFLAPDFLKTLRGLQVWLETNCGNFVEARSYDGAGGIPQFLTATWFRTFIAANTFTTSVASVDTGANTVTLGTLALPADVRFPQSAVWALLSDAPPNVGDPIQAGQVNLDAATPTIPIPFPVTTDLIGKVAVVSLGWDRHFPREFRYLYEKTVFIPDADDDGTYDPPQDDPAKVGHWVTHAASTNYKEYDSMGFATDGPDAFVTGELARYVGDNAYDPALGGQLERVDFSDAQPDGYGPQAPYYDNFYRGARSPDHEGANAVVMTGRAVAGNDRQLTTAYNFWVTPINGFLASGVMRAEVGTATGGSATTLVDTSKSASNFWNAPGRWAGFVLELTSGPHAGARLPIVAHTPGTTTLTFAAQQGVAVTAGTGYRIREPRHERNRWRGRTLRVWLADGTTRTATITHSDDTTLYFDPAGFTVAPDARWAIVETPTGWVMRWDGARWAVPTGDDAVRLGVPSPRPFHADPSENLPTIVRRFGRFMRGDYLTTRLLTQIYAGINVLRWTKIGAGWVTRADDAVAEDNYAHGNGDSTIGSLADDKIKAAGSDAFHGFFHASHRFEDASGPPFASGNAHYDNPPDENYGNEEIAKRYGYMDTTNPAADGTVPGTRALSVAADFYVYGQINEADDPPDTFYKHLVAFDDEGETIAYHEWKTFDSVGPTTQTDLRSARFGANGIDTAPNFPPDPYLSATEAGTSFAGYWVGGQSVVLRWDVAGGMTYL